MFTTRRWSGPTVIAAVVLGVSGCAFLRGSAAGSAFVADDLRHLRLPGAATSTPPAVAYRSPYGYEEYDRSQENGRAEALFLRTHGTGIAVDIESGRLESLTRRWSYNRRGATLDWTQPRARTLPGTEIRYRRYTHRRADNRSTRQCVAFIRRWAFNSLDPLRRPARAYFGYWCRPPGRALPPDAAADYLRRIAVVSSPLAGFHLGQTVPRDAAAQAQASGAANPAWGIVPFPFKRFRRYPIGASYSSGH